MEIESNKNIRTSKAGADPKSPRVFDYLDYREYLKAYYEYNKSINPHFSYGQFANKAKFQTRNYLKRIIDGERPITNENLPKFCIALNLTLKESQYFESLINYNQAKDPSVKKYYFQHLREAATGVPNSAIELSYNQYELFSNWYNIPVFDSLSLTHIDPTPENISKVFRKKITPKEVKGALELLEKVGLIYFDAESHRYKRSMEKIKYTQSVVNLAVREFHKQTLSNVIDFIEEEPLDARYLRSLTISINKDHIKEVYSEIDSLIQKLNNKYSDTNGDKNMLMQLNLNVLNLIKNNKGEMK